MKALAWFLVVAVALAAACDHGGNGNPTATGLPVSSYDALDHFDRANGELDLLPMLPNTTPRTEAEWRALVERSRQVGLDQLAKDDRAALLVGAMTAYLKTARELRYAVYAGDTNIGTYTVRFTRDDHDHYVETSMSEARLPGYENVFPAPPRRVPRAPDARIVRSRGSFDQDVFLLKDQTWTCAHEKTNEGQNNAIESIFAMDALAVVIGEARPATPDGWEIEARLTIGHAIVTLDAMSLWPIEWEYEDDPTDLGARARYVLSAVNFGAEFAVPDDVECVD